MNLFEFNIHHRLFNSIYYKKSINEYLFVCMTFNYYPDYMYTVLSLKNIQYSE